MASRVVAKGVARIEVEEAFNVSGRTILYCFKAQDGEYHRFGMGVPLIEIPDVGDLGTGGEVVVTVEVLRRGRRLVNPFQARRPR